MSDGWWVAAKCRGMNTDIFYPVHYTTPNCRSARSICKVCPVQTECLDNALRTPNPRTNDLFGIRAGTTPWQRDVLRRGKTVAFRKCVECGAKFQPEVKQQRTCGDDCWLARRKRQHGTNRMQCA